VQDDGELGIMVNNAIAHNAQLYAQNAKLIGAFQQYQRESIQPQFTNSKIIYMTQLEWYCSTANLLHYSLNRLWHIVQHYVNIFLRRYHNKVEHIANLLPILTNHADLAKG
jgi:hypothetical protein